MSADRHIGATLGPGHPGSSGWRKKLQGPPSLANPSRAPHARGSLLSSSAQAAWPERGLSCHRDGMLATPDGPWLRGAFTCRVEKVWLPRGRGSLAEGHRGCLEGRIVSEGLGGMGEGEAQLHDDKDPSSWTPSFRIVCGTWQGLLERRWAAPSYPHPEPGGMQGPGHYFLRGKKSDSPKKPTPQTSWLSETPGEDVALLRGGLSSTKPCSDPSPWTLPGLQLQRVGATPQSLGVSTPSAEPAWSRSRGARNRWTDGRWTDGRIGRRMPGEASTRIEASQLH